MPYIGFVDRATVPAKKETTNGYLLCPFRLALRQEV